MGASYEALLAPTGSSGTPTWSVVSLPGSNPTQVGFQFVVEQAQPAAPATPSATAAATGGTQSINTWYYAIAALNPAGESVVSTEVHSTITTSTGSTTLSWSAATGAASYKVYVSNTSSTYTHYLATVNTTLTDSGQTQTASAGPNATSAGITYKVQGTLDGTNFYDVPWVSDSTATESNATKTVTGTGASVTFLSLVAPRFFSRYRLVTSSATGILFHASMYAKV